MEWFRNLKVKAKLVTGFLFVVALSVVIGAVGIYGILTMDRVSETMYYDQALPLGDLSGATEYFQRLRVQSRNAIIYTGQLDELRVVENDITARFAMFESSMQAYKPSIKSDDTMRLYDATGNSYYNVFKPGVIEIIDGAKNGVDSVTLLQMMTGTTIAANEIADNLSQLTQVRMGVMQEANEDSTVLGTTLLTAIIIVMAVAVIISIFLAIYISNIISKPIATMSGFLKMAGTTGDISLRPEDIKNMETLSRAKDEIGELSNGAASFVQHVTHIAEELNSVADGDLTLNLEILSDKDVMGKALVHMVDNLNSLFSDINKSTSQVSSGSKQIADGAQSLAQGSTEQASSIEELSASISEIAEKTKYNAEKAGKAADLAYTIKHNAEEGSRQMDEMTAAVKDINTASQNIKKVIKVIDDIAFQTNILALNAAVEAARAGQHGKGFAVVAEEVRNLASKSADAARETGEMIENSMEKAELGSRIADDTAASLVEIVQGINESSQIVSEIAQSSDEQSAGITQINVGIDQVAQVVQQNSATAEQSAAASEEMSGLSAMLEDLVAQFKLKETGPGLRLQSGSTSARKQSAMPEESHLEGVADFGKY